MMSTTKVVMLMGVNLSYNPSYELEYPDPDMPAWRYLRDIITPKTMWLLSDNNRTSSFMAIRSPVNPELAIDAENKFRPIKEFVDPRSYVLHYQINLEGNWGRFAGNACEEGSNVEEGCPICLPSAEEPNKYDIALVPCLHRFHGRCLRQCRSRRCPLCNAPFTGVDELRIRWTSQ